MCKRQGINAEYMGAQANLAQAYSQMTAQERPQTPFLGELAVIKCPRVGTIVPCRLYGLNEDDGTYNTDLGERVHASHVKPVPEELRAQPFACFCGGVGQAEEHAEVLPAPKPVYNDKIDDPDFKWKFQQAEELKTREIEQMLKKEEEEKLARARELEQKQQEENLRRQMEEEEQRKAHALQEAQRLAEEEAARNRAEEEERRQKEKAQADADYAQKEAERHEAEAERQRQAEAEAKAREKEMENNNEKETLMRQKPKCCCIVQ
eukprot:NODE_14404_length_1111_cov_2.082317.p1 GENE.NODE_14404_length_1111_cov_2.082317~~NODE_14404_length_1111_cov_2.082317.p1  ORF type:complete len:264 (-),score=88.42 NODE_14404_length_1111_cov_2.082317:241-1032(-)